MKVTPYLKILAEKDGSDLYLSTGAPPSGKFHGKLDISDEDRFKSLSILEKEEPEEELDAPGGMI